MIAGPAALPSLSAAPPAAQASAPPAALPTVVLPTAEPTASAAVPVGPGVLPAEPVSTSVLGALGDKRRRVVHDYAKLDAGG